ncbi:MAG: fumarylacetoacetate hydrolase family protein, partial [Candidatus Udaeobacter sp.]
MKLLRYGPPGEERPGLLDRDGQIRSLAGVVDDIAGQVLGSASLDKLRRLDEASLPVVGPPSHVAASLRDANASFRETRLRIGPCVGRVGKMMCIGLNYAEHAAETGAALPKEPVLFMKATSAINGPYDDIRIPRGSTQTDWEV